MPGWERRCWNTGVRLKIESHSSLGWLTIGRLSFCSLFRWPCVLFNVGRPRALVDGTRVLTGDRCGPGLGRLSSTQIEYDMFALSTFIVYSSEVKRLFSLLYVRSSVALAGGFYLRRWISLLTDTTLTREERNVRAFSQQFLVALTPNERVYYYDFKAQSFENIYVI